MKTPHYFAVIPAAGSGTRMGAEIPKQYVPIHHRPMLVHVLAAFFQTPRIARTLVVVHPQDAWIDNLCGAYPELLHHCDVVKTGGATRQETVLNALDALQAVAGDDDWVLVHDAARPGITPTMINHLIDTVGDDAVGGLLALPMVDTLKKQGTTDDATLRVAKTLPRDGVWAAQTPQLFRYGLLRRALAHAPMDHPSTAITDEASAIEQIGLSPMLVQGDWRNMKVTLPSDRAFADLILQSYSLASP